MNSNSNELLIKFKEEILSKLKANENKINDFQRQTKSDIDEKMGGFDEKFDEFSIRVYDIQNIAISQKEKIDKITELQKFQQNTDDYLFTQDLRINNLQKDLSYACSIYDKHYLDNLILPGTIGDYCKYKNLKEYLEVNLNLIS